MRRLPHGEIAVPGNMPEQIASLAEFIVRARTYVARDYRKQISEIPQPESPTRLAQQICQLARGLARLGHRNVVSEQDIEDARRAALDCIPAVRRSALSRALDQDRVPFSRAAEHYAREELRELELMDSANRVSALGLDLLRAAGISLKGKL